MLILILWMVLYILFDYFKHYIERHIDNGTFISYNDYHIHRRDGNWWHNTSMTTKPVVDWAKKAPIIEQKTVNEVKNELKVKP